MTSLTPSLNIHQLYERFNAPIAGVDCGALCAPHNSSGKPFCCDICQAVPAVYQQEWDYLKTNTDLWHIWRGDECTAEPCNPDDLLAETPEYMLLLACQGPAHCQRPYRSLSRRQFPFFPYITSHDRFLGLAYHWDFESTCWVINHLEQVSQTYIHEFIRTYDALFAQWEEDFDSYAITSEDMRQYFAEQKRRIPILHRNGGCYLLSPASERLQRVEPARLGRFGPYKQDQGE